MLLERIFYKPFVYIFLICLLICSCKPAARDASEQAIENIVDSAIARSERFAFTRHYDSAWLLADSIQSLSSHENFTEGLIKSWQLKGYIAAMMNDCPRSINYYKESVKLAADVYPKLKAISFLGIGNQYHRLNDEKQAFDYHLAALKIAELENDPQLLRDCYLQVGIGLYSERQYQQAREYFQLSLANFLLSDTNFHIVFAIQQVQNNIGLTFLEENRPDSALSYFYQALSTLKNMPALLNANGNGNKFMDTSSIRMAEGVCYGNIGRVYQKKSEEDKAEQMLKENIAINSRPGYENGDAARSAIYLAEIYSSKSEIAQSKELIALAERLAGKNLSPTFRRQLLLLKSEVAFASGEMNEGRYQLRAYRRLQDSIRSFHNKVDFPVLLAAWKLSKQQSTLSDLQKENLQRKIYLAAISLAAILVITISLFIIVRLRRYQKENKQLAAQHNEISQLNAELMENRRKLEEFNTRLTEINADKSHILRVVAHDLRNPVAGITGITEMIAAMDHKENAEEISELTDHILQACNRASNIISDLVESSRESQQAPVAGKVKTRLNDILPAILEPLKIRAEEKKINFRVNISEQALYTSMSKVRFERVLENVISNAIKFTSRNGTVEVQVENKNNKLRITVSDNGIGIPKSLLPVIFDKFTKAGRSGTEGEKSIGLGMSIVKQFVDQENGRIWLESEENKGTRVFIEI